MLEEKTYTVSNVNKYIKMMFQNDAFLSNLTIQGEITNFKAHSSGHLYFTLKDEYSTIKCVMFRSATNTLTFTPKDGMNVVIKGAIDVYDIGGTYQIYVRKMEQAGLGELYEKFEKLKVQLNKEGLFDTAHKINIPFLPTRVGVITSPTGAVIRDIINVSTRRFPNPDILLYPALVQGEGMAQTIINGIKAFNENNLVDVIIIARGGGSFEDLFGFNDENLAREIYASKIPIISAVGHETDFTICDFVSDLRAPTPSAAAELAYPSLVEIIQRIDGYNLRLKNNIKGIYVNKKQYLQVLKSSKLQRTPENMVAKYRMMCDTKQKDIVNMIVKKCEQAKNKCLSQIALLDSFSPLKTLSRGYSVSTNVVGKTINKIVDVKIGENITTRVNDGKIISNVIDIVMEGA